MEFEDVVEFDIANLSHDPRWTRSRTRRWLMAELQPAERFPPVLAMGRAAPDCPAQARMER